MVFGLAVGPFPRPFTARILGSRKNRAEGDGLTICGFRVAWCLIRRRQESLIVAGAIMGPLLVVPAPVKVLILAHMRNRESWESFGPSKPPPTQPSAPLDQQTPEGSVSVRKNLRIYFSAE